MDFCSQFQSIVHGWFCACGEAVWAYGSYFPEYGRRGLQGTEQDITPRNSALEIFSPFMSHLLKFTEPPKVVWPAGNQAFNTWALGGNTLCPYGNTQRTQNETSCFITKAQTIKVWSNFCLCVFPLVPQCVSSPTPSSVSRGYFLHTVLSRVSWHGTGSPLVFPVSKSCGGVRAEHGAENMSQQSGASMTGGRWQLVWFQHLTQKCPHKDTGASDENGAVLVTTVTTSSSSSSSWKATQLEDKGFYLSLAHSHVPFSASLPTVVKKLICRVLTSVLLCPSTQSQGK